ncbi:hypothetical protein PR202_gb14329 [Eleusine coracana subsp. coracana]|uniref:Uncharacterized protein n=1 Tax=Eleusine coracana subsp. coracana TaxID=191504 RepID=A0AAV5EUA7_ELECO|nr:hypothetical protein PR202_gb14329 [Eleusine coracana subsp. coracana]
MDIAPPSFSLGIDLDDDDPPPATGSHRREQSRGYVAPDPPSFSMGFDFDDDEEEPQPPARGGEAERARMYAAPDPPSFSLGIDLDDDDEEPQLRRGGRREEQARPYEAPDPPSFSLLSDDDEEFLPGGKQAQPQIAPRASSSTGIEEVEDDFALEGAKPPSPPSEASRFKRLRKGPASPPPAPTPQMRRYEAPDAPSFDLGIEDDDDFLPGGHHHEQSRPQAAPRVPHSVSVEEEDDDFFLAGETLNPDPLPPPTRLKRLQRGPEAPHLAPEQPPSKAPKVSLTEASPEVVGKGALDVGSLEDEIEDFTTDDERPGRVSFIDEVLSYFYLVILPSDFLVKIIIDFSTLLADVPPSVGSCASNSKFSLGALMSQSATKAKVSKNKQQSVFSASKSLEESCTKKLLPKITISPMRKIHLLDSDTDVDDDWNQNKGKKPQNSEPQGSTAAWKGKTTVDDSWATPALDEFCSEYFNSVKQLGQSRQEKSSNFCHSNVPQPKSTGEMEGYLYQSSSSGAVRYDNPTDNSPPAVHYFFHHDPMVRDLVRQRLQHFFPIGTESTRGNEQSRAENLSHSQFGSSAAPSNGWVTPSGRISVPTDVGRRRVHASGTQSGSGHWYTGEDGKKESGRGFHKYRKKGAAKQGSSGSKRGAAKPKREPAATKQSTRQQDFLLS